MKIVAAIVGCLVVIGIIQSAASEKKADDAKSTTRPAPTSTFVARPAPTPTSTLSRTDQMFVTIIRDEGIPIVSDDDAVLKARAICLTFDQHPGTPIEEATLGFITKVETTYSTKQGAFFIGAAVAGYCPEHRTW